MSAPRARNSSAKAVDLKTEDVPIVLGRPHDIGNRELRDGGFQADHRLKRAKKRYHGSSIRLRLHGVHLAQTGRMNWLVWVGLAVVVAAIAAVTGMKPKGTRPVAHTRMMGAGRIALFAIVAILVYVAYRARGG